MAKADKSISLLEEPISSSIDQSDQKSISKIDIIDSDSNLRENGEKDFEQRQCDERPFLCDVCEARFNRRSTLWNHKRIHSECRPFVCPTCNHRFKWKNSLKCHQAMHARKGEHDDTETTPETGINRERKKAKRRSAQNGTKTELIENGNGNGKEIGDFAGSEISTTTTINGGDQGIDFRYSSNNIDQPQSICVTQLSSLVSISNFVDQASAEIDNRLVQQSIDQDQQPKWYSGTGQQDYGSNDNINADRQNEESGSTNCGAYYAKVLPCHMW